MRSIDFYREGRGGIRHLNFHGAGLLPVPSELCLMEDVHQVVLGFTVAERAQFVGTRLLAVGYHLNLRDNRRLVPVDGPLVLHHKFETLFDFDGGSLLL